MTVETPASTFRPAPIPSGRVTVGETEYLPDAKGALVPVSLIKPQRLLEDELVRKLAGYMIAASEQLARLKAHCFDDIASFEALLAQEYGSTVGGPKGNRTLMTHDGLFKVTVQVADRITFGPELQVAKTLLDECLNEWSEGTRDELKALIQRAFATDREGQVSRSHITMLLQIESADPRWQRAMAAVRDSIRVVGAALYCRCYRRDRYDAPWQTVVLDMAGA